MVGFHELTDNITLDDDDDFDSDEDISEFQLGDQARLAPFEKSNGNHGLFASVNSASAVASGNHNYFSFHHMHSNDLRPVNNQKGRNHSLIDSDLINESPRTHSASPIAHLPQTDFAPRKGMFHHNPESWFELFRVKYTLYLVSLLGFVSIITFFLAPRPIDATIEITIQKLEFPSAKSQVRSQMCSNDSESYFSFRSEID